MPPLEVLLPFALGILVLQLSPGPDMLLVLDRGMAYGAKVAFSTIAGIVLVAGAVQLALLVLGLGALVHRYPEAATIFRSVGAAYLGFIGARMLTTPLRGSRGTGQMIGVGAALWEGALNSLTNPKTFVFLFVVLPQFTQPGAGSLWLQLLVLGMLHKLASFATLGTVALIARKLSRWIIRWPRLLPIQRNCCGLLLIAIAASMAFQGLQPM